MKNKKIGLIIGVLVIILVLVCCWLFFKQGKKEGEEYVIKKWHNFNQNVEILIDDDTVVDAMISAESDSDDDALTGGEYAVFSIKGLKKGRTMVTISVINEDSSAESSETYYFEVNDKLEVKLFDSENNSSVIDVN